jgi:hypothetical protein
VSACADRSAGRVIKRLFGSFFSEKEQFFFL